MLCTCDIEHSCANYRCNGFLKEIPLFSESNGVPIDRPHSLDVKRELIMLSLPAIAGQAIDPFAQLLETAYIGRLGILSFFFFSVNVKLPCLLIYL